MAKSKKDKDAEVSPTARPNDQTTHSDPSPDETLGGTPLSQGFAHSGAENVLITYPKPGSARPDADAEARVAEFRAEQDNADTGDVRNEQNQLIDTREPETAYRTKDNIVYPDPRADRIAAAVEYAEQFRSDDREVAVLPEAEVGTEDDR